MKLKAMAEDTLVNSTVEITVSSVHSLMNELRVKGIDKYEIMRVSNRIRSLVQQIRDERKPIFKETDDE